MSNSGTFTSCFADFIKLPIPALRATRSPSSFSVSSSFATRGGEPPREGEREGDARRVGGAVVTSMSMRIEDLWRSAGSSAKRVDTGLGGRRAARPSRTTVDGRWKDHERTRSSARTWHPGRQVWSENAYMEQDYTHTHSAEDAGDLEDEVELGPPGDFTRALRCLERFRLELREQQREAGIVVVWVSDFNYRRIDSRRHVL